MICLYSLDWVLVFVASNWLLRLVCILFRKIFVPMFTCNELFHWAAGTYDKDLFSSEQARQLLCICLSKSNSLHATALSSSVMLINTLIIDYYSFELPYSWQKTVLMKSHNL